MNEVFLAFGLTILLKCITTRGETGLLDSRKQDIETGKALLYRRASELLAKLGLSNHAKDLSSGNSRIDGPVRHNSYDPTIGYEPYWADGDWVFHNIVNGSSTKGPNCPYLDDECPDPYTKFGYICARNLKHYAKTFETYCDMLKEDCRGREDWLIIYRGPCQQELRQLDWSYYRIPYRANSWVMWWSKWDLTTVYSTYIKSVYKYKFG